MDERRPSKGELEVDVDTVSSSSSLSSPAKLLPSSSSSSSSPATIVTRRAGVSLSPQRGAGSPGSPLSGGGPMVVSLPLSLVTLGGGGRRREVAGEEGGEEAAREVKAVDVGAQSKGAWCTCTCICICICIIRTVDREVFT